MSIYSISKAIEAIRNPHLAVQELNRLYHRRLHIHSCNPEGIDVMEADWDVLVLLDACRPEFLHELYPVETFGTVRSKGGSSKEFIDANFVGRELYDTVCVTGNGWYSLLTEDDNPVFHEFIDLQTDEYCDPETGALHPDIVTEQALAAAEAHPQKRLIVHYMQPHKPYIGAFGSEMVENPPHRLMKAIKRGEVDISRDELHTAYRENLKIVVKSVRKLVDGLSGKVVLSADHGELLGDRMWPIPTREYGHFIGIYVDELVRVPWVEINAGERPTITANPPSATQDQPDMGQVRKRLQQLGYGDV